LLCPRAWKRTDLDRHSERYRDSQGSLYYNSAQVSGQAVYAAAYMIQSSPSLICPYYNNTASYKSSNTLGYYIVCGGQYSNGMDIDAPASTNTPSKALISWCMHGKLTCARSCFLYSCLVCSTGANNGANLTAANKAPAASNTLPATVPESFGLIPSEENPPLDLIHRAYVT
jgi:hypothetical protein